MKLRSFRKNEDGAVAVIVALCMTVLIGFTALAVDYGALAVTKQSLQNAADAVALAAARDRGAKKVYSDIEKTAKEYCLANDVDPDSMVLVTPAGTQTVTVTLNRQVRMGFSAVLTGERTRSVTASATAEAVGLFATCPYAMFAGQRIEDDGSGISINGQNIYINGDIHSNSNITMASAVLGDGATATAVNTTNPSGSGWNSHSIARDMPTFQSVENALDGNQKVVTFSGSYTVKKNAGGFQYLINEALSKYHSKMGSSNNDYYQEGLVIRIGGDLTFKGNGSTSFDVDFPIILIADGDIDLSGACLNSNYNFPVLVMSKEGDITVNGGGACFTGIVYAPKGNITLNGNNAEFRGSLISQNIRKNGGKITVSYQENLDRFLPLAKVHLIT